MGHPAFSGVISISFIFCFYGNNEQTYHAPKIGCIRRKHFGRFVCRFLVWIVAGCGSLCSAGRKKGMRERVTWTNKQPGLLLAVRSKRWRLWPQNIFVPFDVRVQIFAPQAILSVDTNWRDLKRLIKVCAMHFRAHNVSILIIDVHVFSIYCRHAGLFVSIFIN